MNYDILDFPTAWELCKTSAFPHDPKCSYVVSKSALLCDCGAVRCEWERLRKAKENDFRNHTCGECAWAKICELGAYDDIGIGFVCRHRSSDLIWPIDTPACPAFVPREKRDA